MDEIFDFVRRFVKANKVDEADAYALNLMIEELFTNMVRHNPDSTNAVLIAMEREADQVRITMTDRDVEPFDITQTTDVDVEESLQQRPVGGLGIHLVKKLADSIEYDYTDRESRITVIKVLESQDV